MGGLDKKSKGPCVPSSKGTASAPTPLSLRGTAAVCVQEAELWMRLIHQAEANLRWHLHKWETMWGRGNKKARRHRLLWKGLLRDHIVL